MSKFKKQLILHIGFPKAGSTTLQQKIFPNLKEVTYLDSLNFKSLHETIPRNPSDLSNLSPNTVASEWLAHLKKIDTPTAILSNERLTWGIVDSMRNSGADPKSVAKNIKRCFFDSIGDFVDIKVVILIRRAGDLLPSLYAEILKNELEKGRDFDDFVDKVLGSSSAVAWLYYKDMALEFFEEFGNRNVFIAPFEGIFDINNNKLRYSLAEFIGIDADQFESIFDASHAANKRSSKVGDYSIYVGKTRFTLAGSLIRKVWYIAKPTIKPLLRHGQLLSFKAFIKENLRSSRDRKIKISDNQKREINSYFSTSNKELSNYIGLNLQSYKYY